MNMDQHRSYLISLNQLIEEQTAEEPNDFLPPVAKKDFSSYSTQGLMSYLQTAVSKLLRFKSQYNLSDLFDLASEIEKYEKLTQDTEEKIRKRIQVQNELRVKNQDLKWKVEELESKEENYKKKTQTLEVQLNFVKIPKKLDENKVRSDLGKKLDETEKIILNKVARIESVAKDNKELEEQLVAKRHELKILNREKRRIGSVARTIVCSPGSVSMEELQPNPECSIFLTNLMKKPILTSRVRKHFDFKNVVGSPVVAGNPVGFEFKKNIFHTTSFKVVNRGKKCEISNNL